MKPLKFKYRLDPSSPWPYFLLAFALSWLAWLAAIWIGREGSPATAEPLLYLGGLGPLLAALFLLYRTQGPEARRDYWLRLVDARRIGWRWTAVILLLKPGLALLAFLAARLVGEAGELRFNLPADVLSGFSLVAFTLLFGPLPEEMGWRGYALDRLQDRRTAATASLILGAAWGLWHLPLFFIPETYQNGLGAGTAAFWIFLLALLPESLLITWLYNNTGRSTLAAVLFHFMTNLTGTLCDLPETAGRLQFLLLIGAAALVWASWGGHSLRQAQAVALEPAARQRPQRSQPDEQP